MIKGTNRGVRKIHTLPAFPLTSGDVVWYIMEFINAVNASGHRPQCIERKLILRGLQLNEADVRLDMVPRKHDPVNRALVQSRDSK